ncbi:sensor histidine kinase [Agromyces aureus]|uniref:histidine kinase n=1 Tax=Agromyces aureus TaxID=453304 RepID=A0A191WHZ7_9MICO|nr:HAMP domain-containing sensor histidine kinase [Agromyces aureus]ANJ27798.1 hypothetical protein ATC03_14850 [Agromyces aureus]
MTRDVRTRPREAHGHRVGLLAWRPRLTIRTRLTLAFTTLLAIAGISMVIVVTLFMRTVPTYVAIDNAMLPAAAADEMTFAGQPTLPPEYLDANGVEIAPVQTTSPISGALVAATVAPGERFATTTTATDAGIASKAATISLRSPLDILNTSLFVSAIVLAVLLVAGALLAWLISGRLLRPLQAINRAAKLAGTASFDHRVGLDGPRDEVRDLSDTFDDMLERLDGAFRSHQRFAANASHELRTPLAATQTMLEVTLADPDAGVEELREVSRRVLEMNRRNTETVEALLDLAEIGRRPIRPKAVDLTRLVDDAVADAALEIAARALTVQVEASEAIARGDEVLLRQAISNLVRNAVRHNRDHGTITIRVARAVRTVSLSIENTGAPLTAARVHEFTEPFARGSGRTASTSESVRGHGLGLAIVSSVVDAHHGSLELAPREGGGLVVDLTLPAASNREGSRRSGESASD